MNFDFPAFLVLITAITGLIWLLDHLLWAPKRAKQKDPTIKVQEPYLVE
ncbi:MAG: signal peptidase I, partial [Chromatiales bacterium]|nr:signal peptidase I [Chromatiales bacterium]